MGVYLFGDLHRHKELECLMEEAKAFQCTSEDILIILGDFGGIWYGKEEDEMFLEHLCSCLPFNKICFIDGNHENFEYIKSPKW